MPQWTVLGADKSTGKDITLLVEAPDLPKARAVAEARNLAIATIAPADPHAPTLAYQRPQSPELLRLARTLAWLRRAWLLLAFSCYATAAANALVQATLAVGHLNRLPAYQSRLDALADRLVSSIPSSLWLLAAGAVAHSIATAVLLLQPKLLPRP